MSSIVAIQGVHSYLNVNTLRLFVNSKRTLAITAPEGKGRSLSGTSRRSFVDPNKWEQNSPKRLGTIKRVIMQPADYPGSCDLTKSEILKKSIHEKPHRRHNSCWNVGDDRHDGIEVKYHEDGCEKVRQKPAALSKPVLVGRGSVPRTPPRSISGHPRR